MNNVIDEINNRLDKALKNKSGNVDRENLFNLGVELGREIALLVRESIKKQINLIGSWTLSKNDYFLDRFDDEVVKSYQIQVVRCDMFTYGGEFFMEFKVCDDLENLFEKFNISTNFSLRIDNDSGEEERSFSEPEEVDRKIRNVTLLMRDQNEWPIEKFDEVFNEITKNHTLILLKNSN